MIQVGGSARWAVLVRDEGEAQEKRLSAARKHGKRGGVSKTKIPPIWSKFSSSSLLLTFHRYSYPLPIDKRLTLSD